MNRFVIQWRSVYDPREWVDGDSYHSLAEARDYAKFLRSVNPNVRVIDREVHDREVPMDQQQEVAP